MDIEIRNCNNLDAGTIHIEPNRLNVKYGPNGTGKTTLAKALQLRCKGNDALNELRPFKHRQAESTTKSDVGKLAAALATLPAPVGEPTVSGADSITTVATFNEEYVSQFVFQADEVLKNSFEIFVKNPDYDAKMLEIDKAIADIKEAFRTNQQIDAVLKDLADLSESFGKSGSGYSKSGRIGKGLGSGNKIQHVPQSLMGYSSLIRSTRSVQWIKWQVDGNEFLEISDQCPYCTSPTHETKDTIKAVALEYDAKCIEHLLALQGIVDRLGSYFSEATKATLAEIVESKSGLSKEQLAYLLEIKAQVVVLHDKLTDAKTISFFSLRDVEKIDKQLSDLKIDLALLAHLNSANTTAIVDTVNACLEDVRRKAGTLQGDVAKQKAAIAKTIERYKKEIDEFLNFAGYKYFVDIERDGTSYKMKLKHKESSVPITSGVAHLSYGEKNAFALVLFMYEVVRTQPTLIILDDPISSFDKNKKFAVLDMLFTSKDSLAGRTVLMLTHDIEPMVDLIKTLSGRFHPKPIAHFLKTKSGVMTEIEVKAEDILSFRQICVHNMLHVSDEAIRLIYLRRYYELSDDKGVEYQLLASLLKARDTPTLRANGSERTMTQVEIDEATAKIRVLLTTFDYTSHLSYLKNQPALIAAYKATNNNYEKLQLFRLLDGTDKQHTIVQKFVNETFHIENEYVMQLNAHKYDFVPAYVIEECDKAIPH